MNTEKTLLLEQVGFWSLLGPFIMLVTLTILLLNPLQQNLLIPGIALVSFPLCWKWKVHGLYSALFLLGCVLLYQFWTAPSERLFWDLLLGAAAALTFTITALCSQEVEGLIDPLQGESDLRLQKFQDAHAKIQELERQIEELLSSEKVTTEYLQQKLDEADLRLQASEETSLALREKSAAIAAQNESLLRELFQKRHEYEKLLQQLSKQEAAVPQLETVPLTSPESKSKSAKSSKTNDWANTILSRWSEPEK